MEKNKGVEGTIRKENKKNKKTTKKKQEEKENLLKGIQK